LKFLKLVYQWQLHTFFFGKIKKLLDTEKIIGRIKIFKKHIEILIFINIVFYQCFMEKKISRSALNLLVVRL